MSARLPGFRREGRRLVLVDIENVVGGALRTAAAAAWSQRVVASALSLAPGEHVIVGVSSVDGLFHAKRSWPQARIVVELGCDGADRALLDVLCNERVADRFDRVSIVSGDGTFAEEAARLGQKGVAVTAAGWRMCMAPRLRLAAHQTLLLDEVGANRFGVTA